MVDCPVFWQTRKVEIKLLNMQEEDYMDHLQISAFIAIGIDFLVGFGSFLIVWNYSNMPLVYKKSIDELGPWSKFGCTIGPFTPFRGFGKIKFVIMKIILGFGLPLSDTALGKGEIFLKYLRCSILDAHFII